MPAPFDVGLPPNLELWDGCTIRVTALDPASGAVVSGVNVSAVALQVELTSGDVSALTSGPFMLVPGPGA